MQAQLSEQTLQEEFFSLLPFISSPKNLLAADSLPCHGAEVISKPTEVILSDLNRQVWKEGLYIEKINLPRIKRYRNPDNSYKHNLDETQFLTWIKAIQENTAQCETENKKVGKGVFVPPGKKLEKGVFIPSTGIIKLDPTQEELETKAHCSALQDLDDTEKKIYGLIDPEKVGGILDLINHAPEEKELANFKFKSKAIRNNVATANLKSVVKFYQGYAIMGVEVCHDIDGGQFGNQLLWSYARSCEYSRPSELNVGQHALCLFDKREGHNGEIIDPTLYDLAVITIFIDTGEPLIRQIAKLPRWELMENPPTAPLIITTEDPYSLEQSAPVQSPVLNGYLQSYLKKNPQADRMILSLEL